EKWLRCSQRLVCLYAIQTPRQLEQTTTYHTTFLSMYRFCHSCISACLKNKAWMCPYCHAYLPSEGIPATNIAKKMGTHTKIAQNAKHRFAVCLSEMRAHLRTCEKCTEKYGCVGELGDGATSPCHSFSGQDLLEQSIRYVFCPLMIRSNLDITIKMLFNLCNLNSLYSLLFEFINDTLFRLLARKTYLLISYCSSDAQKNLNIYPHTSENCTNLKTVSPPCNKTILCPEN
uniref:RING-type E3 ubiquitin transferase n=1 Tax=Falco tinnunculus TaxID=100819 RepID=A0A8C4XLA1_FALTI